jgi:flagellar biosynthesis/type III secretory pathway protein FliH
MSEQVAVASPAAARWLAMLGERNGAFAPDQRFAPHARQAQPVEDHAAEAQAAEAEGRRAVQEAFAAGLTQGRAEGEEQLAAERASHERLRLSLGRLDETMRRALADRLAETVTNLCEATLAPLALDPGALQHRCTSAARLLGEAQDRLELHLHPDDIIGLNPEFAAGWRIVARPDFERGAVRIEGEDAGIVDGPAEWRAALTAAFAC